MSHVGRRLGHNNECLRCGVGRLLKVVTVQYGDTYTPWIMDRMVVHLPHG